MALHLCAPEITQCYSTAVLLKQHMCLKQNVHACGHFHTTNSTFILLSESSDNDQLKGREALSADQAAMGC